MENWDYIACECDLDALRQFVTSLEYGYDVQVVVSPAICLTMIKAEDTVEFQPFYLGEALTTECEVLVKDKQGIGICLGDEPVRAYCIAVIDALAQLTDKSCEAIHDFLHQQSLLIEKREQEEYNQILRTRVDFKLMEQD